MKFSSNLRDLRALLDRNSPVILTGMAVGGAFLTTYLTYKGSHKAAAVLREESMMKIPDGQTVDSLDGLLSNAEKFTLTWKFYAPAAATLVGTSGCMIMATRIGLDRTAALAAAAVVSERTYDQYKDKVKETLGEKKHTKVVDEVAQDQVAALPPGYLPVPPEGLQTYIDAWSGRVINTTRESMNKALNDFNKDLLYGSYASLNEFYKRLGLSDIQEGDEIGWDKSRLVELVYTTTLKDDRAVVVFTFDSKPSATFRDEHEKAYGP